MKRLRLMFLAPLALLGACAAAGLPAMIGGASNVLSAINAVAAVAGRPANVSADQTAAVVPASNAAKAGAPTVGDQVIMRGTQGLIVANNAYQGATAVAEGVIRARKAAGNPFPVATLQRVKALNDRAIFLLEAGGGGLSAAQRAAEVLNIVAELNVFGGRR
jgi:hypothetical protein